MVSHHSSALCVVKFNTCCFKLLDMFSLSLPSAERASDESIRAMKKEGNESRWSESSTMEKLERKEGLHFQGKVMSSTKCVCVCVCEKV